MDALTLVRQDHRKLEELLQRCQRLDGLGRGDREALRQVQAAIRHHVDQEETILRGLRTMGEKPRSQKSQVASVRIPHNQGLLLVHGNQAAELVEE